MFVSNKKVIFLSLLIAWEEIFRITWGTIARWIPQQLRTTRS